ncbi:MAG: site-2 protease family protein [Nitrososphaerales archaeon]
MSSPPLGYDTLVQLISDRFTLLDRFIREDGSYEFRIEQRPDMKENFKSFYIEIKKYGYVAAMRKAERDVVLTVAGFMPARKRIFSIKLALVLLLVTTITVGVDGWLRNSSMQQFAVNQNVLLGTIIYVLGVLGIFGIHELGHKLATAQQGLKSSLPYFIPGIPGILPTMGAIILSREPIVNRDDLFDLGFSGPIAGLAIVFIVAYIGAVTSISLPLSSIPEGQLGNLPVPLFMTGIFVLAGKIDIFSIQGADTVLILSPLGFAAWLGFLVTFLNLLPAGQLDGGHIARATLGRAKQRITTWISIFVFAILGFWIMAILVLMISMRAPDAPPLDDVSPLSKRRRLLFVGSLVLAALCAPIPF